MPPLQDAAVVLRDLGVIGYQYEIVGPALDNQHAVERIPVAERQFGQLKCLPRTEDEPREACLLHGGKQVHVDVQLADRDLMAISAIETALTNTAFAGFSIDSRRLRASRSGSVSAWSRMFVSRRSFTRRSDKTAR